jgi:hypothetical protein
MDEHCVGEDRWRCGNCGLLFYFESDARGCCRDGVQGQHPLDEDEEEAP